MRRTLAIAVMAALAPSLAAAAPDFFYRNVRPGAAAAGGAGGGTATAPAGGTNDAPQAAAPVTASAAVQSYSAIVGDVLATGTVVATGGTAPYAFSAITQSGTGPAAPGTFSANGSYGFTVDNGMVGTWSFRKRATSAADPSNYGDTAPISVSVTPLSVNAIPAQTALHGVGFSLQLSTNSSWSPSWAAPGLPTGLQVSPTGLVSGLVTAANGVYTVTATASLGGATPSKTFTVTVADPPPTSWAAFQSALTKAGWSITKTTCAPCGYKATYAQFMALSSGSPYNVPAGWGAAYSGGPFGGVFAHPPMKDTNNVMGGAVNGQNSFGPSTGSTATAGGDFSAPAGTSYQMIFMDYSNTSTNNEYAITISR